jgi:hypothetical protein
VDFLWMFLGLLLSPFESAVTGHAWDKQFPITLFGDGQVSGGKFNGQLLVRAVGRTGSAASPVFQFMEFDIE